MFRRAAEMEKGSFLTRASAFLYSFSMRVGLSIVRNRTSARVIAAQVSPSSSLILKTGSMPKRQVQRRRDSLRASVAVPERATRLVGVFERRLPRIGCPLREIALDPEHGKCIGTGIETGHILGKRIEVGLEGIGKMRGAQRAACRGRPPRRRANRRAIASWHCFRATKRPRRGPRAR